MRDYVVLQEHKAEGDREAHLTVVGIHKCHDREAAITKIHEELYGVDGKVEASYRAIPVKAFDPAMTFKKVTRLTLERSSRTTRVARRALPKPAQSDSAVEEQVARDAEKAGEEAAAEQDGVLSLNDREPAEAKA